MSGATSRVTAPSTEPREQATRRTAGIAAGAGAALVVMLVALLLPVRAMAIPHGPGEEPIKVKMIISVSGEGGGNYVIGPSEANAELSIKAKVGSTVTVSSGSTDTDDVLDGTQGPVSQSHMLTASWNLKGQQVQDDPQGYTPPQHQVQLEEGDLGDTVVITLSMSDDRTLYNDTNDPTATLNILVVGVTINLPVTLFGRGDQTHDPPDSTHFSATGTPGPGTYTWSSAAGIFDGDRDGHFGEEGDNVIVVDEGGSGCTMPFRATSIGKDVSVTVQYTYENITVSNSDEVTVVGVEIADHNEMEYVRLQEEVSFAASPSGPSPGTYLWSITGTVNVDYEFVEGSATSQNITIKFLTTGNKSVDVQFTYTGVNPEKTEDSTRQDVGDEDEDGETNDFIADPANLCTIDLDLQIYDGQGGSLIPEYGEYNEETRGAFSVANLNDTDGDGPVPPGTPDKDDGDIPGEVDLIKIVFDRPVPDLGLSVTLTLTGDGTKVKVWKNSTKSEGEEQTREFDTTTTEFPVELWVEGRETSGSPRDVEIKLSYYGVEDIAKATFVWAERTHFWDTHVPGPAPSLNADADGATIINTFNSFYDHALGYGIFHAMGPTLGLCFGQREQTEFTVYPSGIGSENGVVLDVSRQGEWRDHAINDGNQRSLGTENFPGGASRYEEANDDPAPPIDEDNDPTNDHIYDVDGPAFALSYDEDFIMSRNTFRSFVRVKFSGAAFTLGNDVEGSRCSPLEEWHFLLYVKRGPAGGDKYIQDNNAISASAPRYTGAGNGTMTVPATGANAVTEGWTVKCITAQPNGGIFSVTGTVSGAQNNYDITTGEYTSNDPAGRVQFTITDGANDFADGDEFKFSTFKTGAMKKNEIKTGKIDVTLGP